MVRSVQHEMLPQATADEASRQEFVVAFKQTLNRELRRSQGELFENVVAPRFAARHGHAPESRDDIRTAMQADPSYREWSALARAGVRRVLARFSGVAIAAGTTRTLAVRLDADTYRALQVADVERVRARLVTHNRPAAGGVLTARSAFWIRIAPLAPAANVTG